MNLENLYQQYGDSTQFNPEFRRLLEDYLPILQASAKTIEIEPILTERFHGNFYGLLKALEVDKTLNLGFQAYYVTMIVNGFNNPFDYTRNVTQLKVPDMMQVHEIIEIFKTKKKV